MFEDRSQRNRGDSQDSGGGEKVFVRDTIEETIEVGVTEDNLQKKGEERLGRGDGDGVFEERHKGRRKERRKVRKRGG